MGWGVVGVPPRHVHVHAHMCTHIHAHMVNMIISCKWPPPLGESLGIPYDVIRTCTCMRVHACACMCTCVGDTLSPPPSTSTHPLTNPHPHPPTPYPPGETPGISQNWIALELIKIFQFRLKIWNLWRLPHPCVGIWFGGWVGGLMGGVRSKH